MNKLGMIISFLFTCSLLFPTASNYYNHFYQNKMIKQVVKESNFKKEVILTEQKPDNIVKFNPKQDYQSQTLTKTLTGNFIEIPALGLKKTIYEGNQSNYPKQLRKGPIHLEESVNYGVSGICVIAGHRTTYGAPFRNIDRLNSGDKVIIKNNSEYYEYVVKDSTVVQPDIKFDFQSAPGKVLYLSTCHPPYSGAKRLLVRCILKKQNSPPKNRH